MSLRGKMSNWVGFKKSLRRTVVAHNKQPGFTLIELLVTISIVGLISSITMVSLSSAARSARDSRRLGDLDAMQKAIEFYYLDNDIYPRSATANNISTLFSHNAGWQTLLGAALSPYIANMPKDPINIPNTYANPRPYSNVYLYSDNPKNSGVNLCVASIATGDTPNGNIIRLGPGSYYLAVPTENVQKYAQTDPGVSPRYIEYMGGNYRVESGGTC